jgi:hypothetical protein
MEELRSIKNYFSVLKVPKMYQGSITPDTRTLKYTIPVEKTGSTWNFSTMTVL